ncbi:MAG: energy transducer TonB [Erysipelotrichia bacterium]|nr:energy transducer TonB [Erysipelotrichia bacterium]
MMTDVEDIQGSKFYLFLSFFLAMLVQAILGGVLWQICGTAGETGRRKIVPLLSLQLNRHVVAQAPSVQLPPPIKKPEPLKEVVARDSEPSPMPVAPVVKPLAPSRRRAAKHKKPVVKKQLANIFKPSPKLEKIDEIVSAAVVEPAEPVLKTVPAEEKSEPTPDAAVATPPELSEKMQSEISRYLANVRRQLEKNKKYPQNARRQRLEGKVTVAFSILADGRVDSLEAVEDAPIELIEAALSLVKKQKFAAPPAGWLPASRIEFPVTYKLR